MSRNLSRVVLAAGLLVGGLSFSSCSQDGSPRMEETDSVKYSRVSLSLSGVDVAVQPLEESSARALSLELNENNKMLPKVKGLKDGTKVLCIIRSSNPRQPVNYIQATWTKKDGTTNPTYTLSFDDNITGSPSAHSGETTFAYDSRETLGTLSMMIVAGGEWDAATKHLNVSPKLVRAEGTEMEYDMPYISEWRPLDYAFKNGPSDPSSLSLALKGHDPNATNVPHERYTMKPVGMLLRMPVEEEMDDDDGGNYQLNGITIRSTSFGGQGYFNLSESNIKATSTDIINQKERYYRSWWTFNVASEKDETYRVDNPTEHGYDATDVTYYGNRKLRKFKPRYYLFLWVMPRGQQPADVDANDVRTQIYADVDVKPLDGSPVVYANSSSADDLEFNSGYSVVPRMKALPVYASDRLVPKADGSNAAFDEGKSYTLTLNLNRPDLPIELLSQYPVNKDYTGFAKVNSEAAYITNEFTQSQTELNAINTAFSTLGQRNWSVAEFTRITMLFGAIYGRGTLDASAERVDSREAPNLSPTAYADAGSYGVNKLKSTGRLEDIRMLLGLQSSKQGDNVVYYSLIFYPSMVRGRNYIRRGDRLSVLRGEYTTNEHGEPVFRIRLRYLGPYSNDIGVLSPNMPEVNSENEQKPIVAAALQKIIDKGEDYWNDNLRHRDDITRDFPLWKKNPTTGKISKVGDADYDLGKMGYIVFDKDRPSPAYFGQLGIGYPASSYYGYSKISTQAPVFLMRDRLTHK